MSEMIECVAKALARHRALERDGRYDEASWPHMAEEHREEHRDLARAAIEAMLEPTDAMLEAGAVEADACTDGWTARAACLPEHCWGGMISAALAAS